MPDVTVTDGIKRMSVHEFRRLGLLQEVNRRFLHPLGLALEVVVEPGEPERFGGVWDYRDDPEGIGYVEGDLDPEAAARVDRMLADKWDARYSLYGSVVQPIRRVRPR